MGLVVRACIMRCLVFALVSILLVTPAEPAVSTCLQCGLFRPPEDPFNCDTGDTEVPKDPCRENQNFGCFVTVETLSSNGTAIFSRGCCSLDECMDGSGTGPAGSMWTQYCTTDSCNTMDPRDTSSSSSPSSIQSMLSALLISFSLQYLICNK